MCTPVILATRRVRLEDRWEFEVGLDDILLGKPDLQTETLSQKQTKKKPKDDDLRRWETGV